MSFVDFERREEACAVAKTISVSVGEVRALARATSLRETEIGEGGSAACLLRGLTRSRIRRSVEKGGSSDGKAEEAYPPSLARPIFQRGRARGGWTFFISLNSIFE